MTHKPKKPFLKRLVSWIHPQPENQEEIVALLRRCQSQSLLSPEALGMLEGAILFSHMRVRDIMLPKKQMVSIKENASFTEVIATVTQSGHSRFPVTSEAEDSVIGILHAKDLLPFLENNALPFDLSDMCRQAHFVPESKPLDRLLGEFRKNRNHMAIVVDEYGMMAGFVTIEDIIEQIVGDIEDEFDSDEEAYIKSHNAHFIVKAHMPIEEFNEQMHTQLSEDTVDTIGGMVMTQFGYLPKRGESIIIEPFEFKVINADARRIKLLECIDRRPDKTDVKEV